MALITVFDEWITVRGKWIVACFDVGRKPGIGSEWVKTGGVAPINTDLCLCGGGEGDYGKSHGSFFSKRFHWSH
ncbi:MAG: hypothetical protein U0X91_21520 [Spirosomataceae bacterium]